MQAIKNLLDAQANLLKAQENLPRNIKEAAEKLSEKANIDFFDSLRIIYDVHAAPKLSAKAMKPANHNRKGGGRVNPTNLSEIKERADNARDIAKKHCYLAAHELFKRKGQWVRGEDLRQLGIETKYLRSKCRMTACLPRGFIFQSSCHGYKAVDISEALA